LWNGLCGSDTGKDVPYGFKLDAEFDPYAGSDDVTERMTCHPLYDRGPADSDRVAAIARACAGDSNDLWAWSWEAETRIWGIIIQALVGYHPPDG
jgi:hypothetical protein